MRFHILGIPHTVTNNEYNACAYTQKLLKIGTMMKGRVHYIMHYGHEDSDLDCDEHVTVLKNSDFETAYGNYDWRKNFFKYDVNDHAYKTFYKNAIREVGKRKKPNDFILPFWGSGVKPICDAHQDMICVEPGIGYAHGHWAQWKIFESYAIMHAYYGIKSVESCIQNWYDIVIPNYFDKDEFTYLEKKEDFFMFIGRIYEGKGIHIAIQVTELLGAKLYVCGQGSLKDAGYETIPQHVIEVGYVDKERRRDLILAKAGFVASLYNEPFGGTQMEFLLSGTPTITTDWGAFTENNLMVLLDIVAEHLMNFVIARNIDKISPKIVERGLNLLLWELLPLDMKLFLDIF